MPLIRNIQPRKMVTARLASGGTIIAARPSSASTMPSNRNAFQCVFTAAFIADCSLPMSGGISWGRVIGDSRCLPRRWRVQYSACAAGEENLFAGLFERDQRRKDDVQPGPEADEKPSELVRIRLRPNT